MARGRGEDADGSEGCVLRGVSCGRIERERMQT